MDASLLPVSDLAEKGEIWALWELVDAFNHGIGVKADKGKLKYYLIKLSEQPGNFPMRSYGGVLASIGDLVFVEGNYDQAADWYIAALQCFKEYCSSTEAKELIEYYEVEKGLENAFFWSQQIQKL